MAIAVPDEYFFGLTLKGPNAKTTWNPTDPDANEYASARHKLNIRQLILGPGAEPGAVNILQVETNGRDGPVELPICSLQADKDGNGSYQLDLSFPSPPVKFSLLKGSGPIHLAGDHLIQVVEFEDEIYSEEEMEESLGEDENEEPGPPQKRKRYSTVDGAVIPNMKK